MALLRYCDCCWDAPLSFGDTPSAEPLLGPLLFDEDSLGFFVGIWQEGKRGDGKIVGCKIPSNIGTILSNK